MTSRSPPSPASECGFAHCVTCGDDGVPMTVRRVDMEAGLAVCVDDEGERWTVQTALVEPVSAGDRLLVHAGTAIATLTASGTGTGSAPLAGERR